MEATETQRKDIPDSLRVVKEGIRYIQEMAHHPNSDARIWQVAENLLTEIENNPQIWGT